MGSSILDLCSQKKNYKGDYRLSPHVLSCSCMCFPLCQGLPGDPKALNLLNPKHPKAEALTPINPKPSTKTLQILKPNHVEGTDISGA